MIKDFEINEHWAVQIMKSRLELDHKRIEDFVHDHLDNYRDYTSYFNKEYNDHMVERSPHRRELEDRLLTLCRAYGRFVRGVNYDRNVDSVKWWYSVYREGDNHELHNHPQCTLAGTYYVFADEESSEIRYKSPYAWTNMIDRELDDGEVFARYKPETGDVLVWPPWLDHQVPTQKKCERPRIAISFNYSCSSWSDFS